ncbi:hypothetical protein JVX93_21615 [Mycolicibacterium boenickei]|nr:hypothetical protein JVX93_21615 [Mycolicibacterium boenickei]
MNATEDGQPVGECIDTLDAIQRGAVRGILSAADEVLAIKQLAERQTVAINKIRDLHRPVGRESNPRCGHCGYVAHPCPTIRAIDEAGA